MLTGADILGTKTKFELRKVLTPEWEGKTTHIYVRTLPLSALTQMQEVHNNTANGVLGEAEANCLWVIMAACDKNGKRLFSSDQTEALLEEPMFVMRRCALAAMSINGSLEEDEPKRKKKSRRR